MFRFLFFYVFFVIMTSQAFALSISVNIAQTGPKHDQHPKPIKAIVDVDEEATYLLNASYGDLPTLTNEEKISAKAWRLRTKDKDANVKLAATTESTTDDTFVADITASSAKAGTYTIELVVTLTITVENEDKNIPDKTFSAEQECSFELNVTDGEFDVMLYPLDYFDGRSTNKLGVGEAAEVLVMKKEGHGTPTFHSMTITGKNRKNNDTVVTDGNSQLTAGAHSGSATIEVKATINSRETGPVKIKISVVEPNKVQFVKKEEPYLNDIDVSDFRKDDPQTNLPVRVNGFEYKIRMHVFVHPQDVSFRAITIGEGQTPATDLSGDLKHWKGKHPKWDDFHQIYECYGSHPGNQMDVMNAPDFDEAMIQLPYDIGAGTKTWVIPWFYTYEEAKEEPFATATQRYVTDGKILTISKESEKGSYDYQERKLAP